MNPVDVIGYVASALVVLSLAMKSVVKLRLISLAGALIFIVYSIMLGSVPLVITNSAIVGLNLWFLRKEFAPDKDLGAIPIATDSPYLVDFLRSHSADIQKTWPGFTGPIEGGYALLLIRDGLPAGVLIGRKDDAVLRLDLDYVLPAYRDSRIGVWLYGRGAKVLHDAGFTQVIVETAPAASEVNYLDNSGFVRDRDHLVRTL